MIREVTPGDCARIAEIYNYYITDTIVTFEETEIGAEEIANRINGTQAKGFPWIVFEDDGQVLGYAYATVWRQRASYRHCVEAAVYLDRQVTGRGIGRQLYQDLIGRLANMKTIHVVVGGIALPNEASVRLHESLGFENVGIHRQVGRKFGQWIDVQFLQLNLPCRTND